MSELKVAGLDVDYGGVKALRKLSMEVAAGEMVALLGANGAGKTTTLRAISGLVPVKAGSVHFAGERIDSTPAHRLVHLGLAHLPEGRDLFASLTVAENLRYGHWARRRDREDYERQLERVLGYFPRLKERIKQAAGTLSGGEQQMLAVARALMSSPKLLLVDELSLGLAPRVVTQLFSILDEINIEGTSILLVEQFVHMALHHTQRAYVLSKGEVVLSGPSAELADDPVLVSSYLGSHAADAAPAPKPRRAQKVAK